MGLFLFGLVLGLQTYHILYVLNMIYNLLEIYS